MRTAGRTVLIAGSTVVIGMMGLLVLRQPLLTGVAVAAAATVAMVLLGSLTLLPALLGFSGTRLARRSRLLGRRRNQSATARRNRPHHPTPSFLPRSGGQASSSATRCSQRSCRPASSWPWPRPRSA